MITSTRNKGFAVPLFFLLFFGFLTVAPGSVAMHELHATRQARSLLAEGQTAVAVSAEVTVEMSKASSQSKRLWMVTRVRADVPALGGPVDLDDVRFDQPDPGHRRDAVGYAQQKNLPRYQAPFRVYYRDGLVMAEGDVVNRSTGHQIWVWGGIATVAGLLWLVTAVTLTRRVLAGR